jgi:uncharacterized coiled-coil protein SlyX
VAALDDLEARVSALEAAQADYRAVLSAVNALGANQREHSLRLNDIQAHLNGVQARLTSVETSVRTGFRSVDEQLAELNDLIVRGRD